MREKTTSSSCKRVGSYRFVDFWASIVELERLMYCYVCFRSRDYRVAISTLSGRYKSSIQIYNSHLYLIVSTGGKHGCFLFHGYFPVGHYNVIWWFHRTFRADIRIAPYRRYAIASRIERGYPTNPSDRLAARISMQNRNRGGSVVATAPDNDTPLMGSMIIGASPEWVTDHNHRWFQLEILLISVNKSAFGRMYCYWQKCQSRQRLVFC